MADDVDQSWEVDLSYRGMKYTAHVNVFRQTITLSMPEDWPFLDRRQARLLASVLRDAAAAAAASATEKLPRNKEE